MLKKILLTIPFIIGLAHFLFHPVRVLGMNTSIFYLDERITLGAFWLSGLALLTALFSFLLIGELKGKKEKLMWLGYGLFFLALSLDEYFEIHEVSRGYVAELVESVSGFGELWNLSWIFALIIPIIAVISLLIYTIYRVDTQYKSSMIVGLGCFITVLALELIGGNSYGLPIYVAFVGLEETLEMLGVSFFLIPTITLYKDTLKKG